MNPKKNQKITHRAYDKHYKVMAILLVFFAVLLLLALISYTHKDEENARVSLFELFGLLSGDPIMEAKAATARNWLGLFGAWIADLFYNKTVGFAFLPVPLFIIAWSRYLFNGKKVSDLLIKNTAMYFAIAVLFSGFMGTLMLFDGNISDISPEWSGSIGQLLAAIFSSLLGAVGSLILLSLAMLITLYLGSDIKISALIVAMKDYSIKIKEKSTQKINDKLSEIEKNKVTADSQIDKSEEHFAKANVSTEIDKESTDTKPEIINDKSVESAFNSLRQPTIIINRNDFRENPKSSNPFDAVQLKFKSDDDSDEIINDKVEKNNQETNISDQEIEIPAFKPNFKHLKDETFTSMDDMSALEMGRKDDDKDTEQDDSQKTTSKTINFTKADLAIDKNDSSTESIGNNTSDEDDTEIEEPFETAINDVETSETSDKSLTVTVNRPPKEKEPLNLLGTSIHDEEIDYVFPVTEFLNTKKTEAFVDEEELKMNAQILQEKLETFKIYIENLSVTPGPVVTQYEFVPAAGIKISKIESLSDDLAMALKAKGIRIIAPIPGKGTIGVEIPNANPAMVRFGETVESSKFKNSDAKLPLVLGKTISGEIYVIDLAKMPHLLIAGSTGSGKSVGINTIIGSLLYRMHPSELKFVMIDPKKVELPSYSKLKNHYMAASPEVQDVIVTKPEDAVTILKAAVAEMELRYDILASVRQRNIADYNAKVRQGAFKEVKEMVHKPMPYIVVIIDELADLMLIASKEIEEPITRLAQMARAIGIHLVVATQRPSVDVITGIIKANFPARISYLVKSKIDSRTILDMQGAEQLLGTGDMLCLPPGLPKPVRIQNSFISTDEVESLCDFIGNQEGYSEPYYLPSVNEKSENVALYDSDDRDPLFEEAARLIVRHQQGSVSLIQRRLKVGYARAGRIVDELENAGIIGPFDGSKARLVLIESEADLERIL